MPDKTKKLILGTVSDTMWRLLYYDRKEDEELPVGAIENAIKDGTVTVEEILAAVRKEITP